MKTEKSITIKKFGKQDRERKVLLGLVEYYLTTGKPVGSATLKEAGFEELSSATIRNYFANLEESGYLKQQHSSGGRIPTEKAYKAYAAEYLDFVEIDHLLEGGLQELRKTEAREVALFIQQAAEKLSQLTNTAVFLSSPRFDNDFILDIKFVALDSDRCLCIAITDFGVVQTELLYTEKKVSAFSAKRIESYFHYRLTGQEKPDNLETEEEELAKKLYNELMIRYIVGHSNFPQEDIYRTGFSKLLHHPEFTDSTTRLANGLALFENSHTLRLLSKECSKMNKLRFWIGEDFSPYSELEQECSIIAIPYRINQKVVGTVGILGPTRMPYRQYFSLLRHFSDCLSEALTRSLYKFKIDFRQPSEEQQMIGTSNFMLLEDKR
jgi:heat-inducible transcriptional repressor